MVEEKSDKMRNIIIVCEDTYGLDVYMIIKAINASAPEKHSKKYRVLGFLNDNSDRWAELTLPASVLGRVSDWNCRLEAAYVIAIRKPENKRIAVEKLKAQSVEFETIIAPWVQHPLEFEHGEGCVIANYNFKYRSKFGKFVIMDTCMCEAVEIGDYSTLSPFVNITSASIGKNVYIGTHAAVISARTIGDNVTIYPGSIVLSNVKAGTCVAGVPATRNLIKWESKWDERNWNKQ